MKKYLSIKHTVICLLVSACLQANAQGFSPAAMEQLKMQHLWLNSQNASGMVFDNTAAPVTVGIRRTLLGKRLSLRGSRAALPLHIRDLTPAGLSLRFVPRFVPCHSLLLFSENNSILARCQ